VQTLEGWKGLPQKNVNYGCEKFYDIGYWLCSSDEYSSTTLGIMGTVGSTVVEQQTLDPELKGSNRGAVCSGKKIVEDGLKLQIILDKKLRTFSKHLSCLNFN
jgi:hypothetical protein